MGLEKMKFAEDHRLHSVRLRASGLARQHQPFVAFLLFASFVLLCMHLPWGSAGSQAAVSVEVIDPSYNKTIPPGNGTIEIMPDSMLMTKPKFAKIAVASGFEDILYERALATHVRHAQKHGYPMYMARENAADGMFNKIAYILDVLLNELFKPAEERVEWLL
jgi:hypothetical protein